MKTRILALMIYSSLSFACQSNQQIENTFDSSFIGESSDLIFSSPNFSALHSPPLMSGFAYVETFTRDTYCSEKYPVKIGKVTVTKANKTQYSKLPAGNVVAKIGYHAAGLTGGGLTGVSLFWIYVKPNAKYQITLTESRPLLTSYEISIEELTESGAIPVKAIKTNVCD